MKHIAFVGVNDWRDIKQRPQHIAERLSAASPLVYVNPVGYSVFTHLRRRVRSGIQRSWRPRLERLAERLWVLTPSPAFPFSRRFRIFNRLNQALLASQLRPVLERLGMHPLILWVSFPPSADLIGRLKEEYVIFDCLDNYPAFFGGREGTTIAAMETDLLSRADLVLTTSRPLLEKCSRLNANTHWVPNGADGAHFGQAITGLPEPSELVGLPRPRFGYVGTIGRWTDVNLLVELALKARSASVIMIGPWEVAKPPSAPPNFHVLGPRPYHRLPEYLSGLDVGVIPFKVEPLTHAINPVKLFEYAAAGLRIVATATQELTQYASWCSLADSPSAFIAAALREGEEALEGRKNDPLARRAASFARTNDWDDRVTKINRLLEALPE